jgi:Cof subfamily protein (haloacid dehalogenase superfamily)
MTVRQPPSTRISLVISDIDGTLVTDDKVLTPRAHAAVAALHARGLNFSIVSSRPPRAMRRFIEPLHITAPTIGFNGGILSMPDGSVIERRFLARDVARKALDVIAAHGAQAWLFTETEWLVRDPAGKDVAREIKAVAFPPEVVSDFERFLDGVYKIVGVSGDAALLARCEAEVKAALVGKASVARSNPRHFDVTHQLANKGEAVLALSRILGVPTSEIAVIGDGENDVAMFEQAGLSIAMGNATPDVRSRAHFTTATCNDEGFAKAMERYLLADQGS